MPRHGGATRGPGRALAGVALLVLLGSAGMGVIVSSGLSALDGPRRPPRPAAVPAAPPRAAGAPVVIPTRPGARAAHPSAPTTAPAPAPAPTAAKARTPVEEAAPARPAPVGALAEAAARAPSASALTSAEAAGRIPVTPAGAPATRSRAALGPAYPGPTMASDPATTASSLPVRLLQLVRARLLPDATAPSPPSFSVARDDCRAVAGDDDHDRAAGLQRMRQHGHGSLGHHRGGDAHRGHVTR